MRTLVTTYQSRHLPYKSGMRCLVPLLILAGIGCTDNTISPNGKRLLPVLSIGTASLEQNAAAERASAVDGRIQRGIEDDILRIEDSLPGFGGMYIDSTGGIVAYGPADSSAVAVKAVLARYASALHIREFRRSQIASGTDVRVIPAQFPFSHLVVWQRQLSSQLEPGDGVTSIDADEALNRLTIGVNNADVASRLQTAATDLEIPVSAINVHVEPTAEASATLQNQYSPRVGGLQIMNLSAAICTLGFNVTTSTGITGFITASHCARGNVGIGAQGGWTNQMYQSTLSSPVGTIYINHPFNTSDPSCGAYTLCTWADVMLVQYNGATGQKWLMQTFSVGTSNAIGSVSTNGSTWQVNGTDFFPTVGETVDKLGRTTGWTRGAIGATCINQVVTGGSSNYMVICTARVDNASSGQGDSGGPVFYRNAFGVTYAVGTLYAGNANAVLPTGEAYCNASCHYYFNPFQNMQNMIGTTPIAY